MRYLVAVGLAIIVACAGAAGLVSGAKSQLEGVARVDVVVAELAPPSDGFENYLLVGTDSREGVDPNDPDYATMGDDLGSQRSDTIMILRYDTVAQTAALMSFPRDLYVTIGNGQKKNRINTAYSLGPDMLIRTIRANFTIPIHHYVEINFQGFKELVDAVGGVRVCVPYGAKDKNTGLRIHRGGNLLNGVKALRFARSRHYYQFIKNKWQLEGTGDIGRTARQRQFVAALLKDTVKYSAANPFGVGGVMRSIVGAVKADPTLDIASFLKRLKPAADGSIASYGLDVQNDIVNEMSVVQLGGNSRSVLEYFAGVGPAPVVEPPA